MLKISAELSLPADVAGESVAVLAKKGAGKTNTAAVFVEELYDAGIQVVVLDPVGAWWGLRSSFDGKKPGLEIPIFGGNHQDAPLEPTAGALMANVAAGHRQSMVLDLSNDERFPTKASMIRFSVDFAERLFRAKGKQPSSMVLVIEEADEFAPQFVKGDVARMVGAFQQIVKRGRARGIGSISITQRSAAFNKDILEQTDVLVLHRTTGPNDRAAVKKWIDIKADGVQAAEVLESLPSLQDGEAWVWNPENDLCARVQVRRRWTFDSGATPKPGEERVEPQKVAPIDLAKLGAEIEATVEREKENDPTALRRANAELQARLVEADRSVERLERAAAEKRVERVVDRIEIPVFGDNEVDLLADLTRNLTEISRDIAAAAASVESAVQTAAAQIVDRVRAIETIAEPAGRPRAEQGRTEEIARRRRPEGVAPARRPAPPAAESNGAVSRAQQRILNALAALEHIGVDAAQKTQLALFAEASPKSSGYTNNLGHLKNQLGLIDYPSPGRVALTDSGREIAIASAAPSTHDELHRYVFGLVGASKTRLLEQLIAVYPNALPKAELAERAGASASSSGYTNNLGSLRSLGLIDYPAPGQVVALKVLFP